MGRSRMESNRIRKHVLKRELIANYWVDQNIDG